MSATKTKQDSSKRAVAKLNVQHDYITLKLPTGNFTVSFGGVKVSGQLVNMPGAFRALDQYVQKERKEKNMGDVMNQLTDPIILDSLVPGWDKPIIADKFTEGDIVKFKGAPFSTKFPEKYVVNSHKGKYVYINLPQKDGSIRNTGFDAIEFQKVK